MTQRKESEAGTTESTTGSTTESTAKSAYANKESLSPAQLAALMADATGWKPEDGDELTGVVLGIKQGYSDVKDAAYPIVFVLTDQGENIAVHCFQTVLENEMRQQRPVPGERVYIKRIGATGEPRIKGQSPTIRYAVLVERGANADPWAHMPEGKRSTN
jgi:hypothetical protein